MALPIGCLTTPGGVPRLTGAAISGAGFGSPAFYPAAPRLTSSTAGSGPRADSARSDGLTQQPLSKARELRPLCRRLWVNEVERHIHLERQIEWDGQPSRIEVCLGE